jgi:hypothetical protein
LLSGEVCAQDGFILTRAIYYVPRSFFPFLVKKNHLKLGPLRVTAYIQDKIGLLWARTILSEVFTERYLR